MSKYIRTKVKSFDELTARQTVFAREVLGKDADQTEWVDDPTDNNACVPLSHFMRASESSMWDGVYGISHYSAYFIKFDRSQQECTIAYRHW